MLRKYCHNSTRNDYSLWKYRYDTGEIAFSINLMTRNCNLAIVDTRFDVALSHSCRFSCNQWYDYSLVGNYSIFGVQWTFAQIQSIEFIDSRRIVTLSVFSDAENRGKKWTRKRERERERARWNCSSSWDSRQYARPFYSRRIYSRESS